MAQPLLVGADGELLRSPTEFQPLDSELTAISALTSAADKLPYFTGSGSAALATFTVFVRTLVDDPDAATARGTLGLGTVAILASDTDGMLAANSDLRIATQKAVKTYVDNAVAGLLDFKGSTNATANPNYPSGSKGDAYIISAAGKIGGASGKSVDIGDVYVASADNVGGTEASVGTSWFVLEHNLVGALLSANNLSDLANASTARTNLGLGTIATQNSNSVAILGGTAALDAITGLVTPLSIDFGGTGSTFAAGARSNLGLQDLSMQFSTNVSITGGSVTGITDLAIADGGTGASDAATARSNLGIVSEWEIDKVSTSDATASNTQNNAHSELTFAVAGNEVWEIILEGATSANNTTGDVAINITSNGSMGTGQSWSEGVHYNASGTLTQRVPTVVADATDLAASPGLTVNNGDGTIRPFRLQMTAYFTGSGTVTVRYGVAATGSGRTATLYKGARLKARRIRQN